MPTTDTTLPSWLTNPDPIRRYEYWQADMAPTALSDTHSQVFLGALGREKDAVLKAVTDAMMCWYVETCPADALVYHGQDRLLPRFPGETLGAYRARLRAAWQIWALAGTPAGIKLVLGQAGWSAIILEHFHEEPNAWAEFSVFVISTGPNQVPLEQLHALIQQFKAGHTKLRALWRIDANTPLWGDGWLWGDGTAWGPAPILVPAP
jgi:Phage tail protein (Tail_P2_I)